MRFGDARGATMVEFAFTAPVFLAMLIGVLEFGLLLWTQLGLQHATEMAARCASVNSNACGNTANIQNYAATQAYGLNPPPSTFSVSTPACGSQVTANYTFAFVTTFFGAPTLALTAQTCFPK